MTKREMRRKLFEDLYEKFNDDVKLKCALLTAFTRNDTYEMNKFWADQIFQLCEKYNLLINRREYEIYTRRDT
jgi:hypothetical protein